MKELNNAFDLLQTIMPITNHWNFTVFGAFYCMLLEEWCLRNNVNIIDCIEHLYQQIKEVNEELGSYSLMS